MKIFEIMAIAIVAGVMTTMYMESSYYALFMWMGVDFFSSNLAAKMVSGGIGVLSFGNVMYRLIRKEKRHES